MIPRQISMEILLAVGSTDTTVRVQTDARLWDDRSAAALAAVEQMAALRIFQLEVCAVAARSDLYEPRSSAQKCLMSRVRKRAVPHLNWCVHKQHLPHVSIELTQMLGFDDW